MVGPALIIGIAAGVGIVIIAVSIAYEIRDLSSEQVTRIAEEGSGILGSATSLLLIFALLSVSK